YKNLIFWLVITSIFNVPWVTSAIIVVTGVTARGTAITTGTSLVYPAAFSTFARCHIGSAPITALASLVNGMLARQAPEVNTYGIYIGYDRHAVWVIPEVHKAVIV